jgi:hypothetical protein
MHVVRGDYRPRITHSVKKYPTLMDLLLESAQPQTARQ